MRILLQKHWKLLLVLFVAILLRFWSLGIVPASVDWDEAALGYNAYSILTTGKDEYGTPFPLVIRSFDDYKPPLYVYLTIPAVWLFGLSPWSVRLPAAVVGVLAVLGVYILTRELIQVDGSSKKSKFFSTNSWPFISSLLLAISPWHIQFSRIAFESAIGVAINIWAVAFFLKGMREKGWLYVSAILFGLGLYAYHSERIFLPVLAIFLLFIFRNTWVSKWKQWVLFVVLGIVTVLPLIPVTFTKTSLTRLQGTSALADQTMLLKRSVEKLQFDATNNIFWGVILDNRRIEWAKTLFAGYLSHFSFRWLFLTGDNPRHHAPDMGLLYLWELPFVLWGMFELLRRGGKKALIVFVWFFTAPIAASPTTELPHAIRTLVFLPSFQLFAGLGLLSCLHWLSHKEKIFRAGFMLLLGILIAWNIVYYLHMYFGHMDREYSAYWQYGYKQAVEYAQAHKDAYQKIVVSTKLEQPHMFFLFYLVYDPRAYLASGGTVSGGFAESHNAFDKYEFRPIHWAKEVRDGQTLYIGKPEEVGGSPLKVIDYLDGTPAIVIASR